MMIGIDLRAIQSKSFEQNGNGNMKIYCRYCDKAFRLYSYRDSVIKVETSKGSIVYAKSVHCPCCDKNDYLMFFEKEYERSSMPMREEI